MKNIKKFTNHFITRFVGVLIWGIAFFVDINFNTEAFNVIDILCFVLLILAGCLIANSWNGIKKLFKGEVEE